MATYREIQEYVRKKHSRVMKTCWIAHVKELNGLITRRSANRASPDARAHPCPSTWQTVIEDALRHFGML